MISGLKKLSSEFSIEIKKIDGSRMTPLYFTYVCHTLFSLISYIQTNLL